MTISKSLITRLQRKVGQFNSGNAVIGKNHTHNITTIVFDLSEVLLRGLLGSEDSISRILGKRIINADLQGNDLKRLFVGDISEDEYWSSIVLRKKWDISPSVLKQVVRDNFCEIKGTRGAIVALRYKGYRLGLISNHAKEWIDYCESAFSYRDLFDDVVYSFDVGTCKPDKRIYQYFLRRASVSASECAFIDDSMENVKAAQSLGMHAIRFSNHQRLLTSLGNLGIEA